MPSLNVGSHPRTNTAWCQVQCSELDNFLIAVHYYVPVAYLCFLPRPRHLAGTFLIGQKHEHNGDG